MQGFIAQDPVPFELPPPVLSGAKATGIVKAEWGHIDSPYLNIRTDEPQLNILDRGIFNHSTVYLMYKCGVVGVICVHRFIKWFRSCE